MKKQARRQGSSAFPCVLLLDHGIVLGTSPWPRTRPSSSIAKTRPGRSDQRAAGIGRRDQGRAQSVQLARREERPSLCRRRLLVARAACGRSSSASRSIVETDGGVRDRLQGKIDSLEIEQTYSRRASPSPTLITEQITLRNPSDKLVENPGFACGFTKKIHDGKDWLPGVAESRFCDVPYRRHPETGELCDWTVPELAAKKELVQHGPSAMLQPPRNADLRRRRLGMVSRRQHAA